VVHSAALVATARFCSHQKLRSLHTVRRHGDGECLGFVPVLGVLRDDGNRGLPFNEDPMAADGGGAASKLANMTNSAKSVPGSRLR
jgi:hypothetical protein